MTEQEKAAPVAKNVYAAISSVMADLAIEGISKNRKNQQQGYSFRGIDDIYNALSGSLSRHSLVILPRVLGREVTEREAKGGNALFYVVVEVEFDLVAGDGSKHTIKTYGEAMDSGDKATNKAMSAAFKYACMQAFCIPTEGDNDADAVTHEIVHKAKAQKQEPVSKVEQEVKKIGKTELDLILSICSSLGLESAKVAARYGVAKIDDLPLILFGKCVGALEATIDKRKQEAEMAQLTAGIENE